MTPTTTNSERASRVNLFGRNNNGGRCGVVWCGVVCDICDDRPICNISLRIGCTPRPTASDLASDNDDFEGIGKL